MRYLDLTLAGAAQNLALDEALLLSAEASTSGEALRLWEYPDPVVVLGAGCRLGEDVHEDACRADSVPILRRSSGGGTVLLGLGCLLYTLVLRLDRHPALATIDGSYRFILGRITEALISRGLQAEIAGTSDLTVNGRKFSGNAQQRKRDHLLHHGTLLYGFNRAHVSRYLRPPPRQPEYRSGRAHGDFIRDLPMRGDDLRQLLIEMWEASERESSWPTELVSQLVAEKYQREEFIRRR